MSEPLPTLFDGVTINDERDNGRLQRQLTDVRTMIVGMGWWTLGELARATGYPEASVSARLRDLRKARFGGYTVERKYVSKGLWAYKVSR
jgi:DNA-binding IclR family transcriptional regulator